MGWNDHGGCCYPSGVVCRSGVSSGQRMAHLHTTTGNWIFLSRFWIRLDLSSDLGLSDLGLSVLRLVACRLSGLVVWLLLALSKRVIITPKTCNTTLNSHSPFLGLDAEPDRLTALDNSGVGNMLELLCWYEKHIGTSNIARKKKSIKGYNNGWNDCATAHNFDNDTETRALIRYMSKTSKIVIDANIRLVCNNLSSFCSVLRRSILPKTARCWPIELHPCNQTSNLPLTPSSNGQPSKRKNVAVKYKISRNTSFTRSEITGITVRCTSQVSYSWYFFSWEKQLWMFTLLSIIASQNARSFSFACLYSVVNNLDLERF